MLLLNIKDSLGSGCGSVGCGSLTTPEICGSNPVIGKILPTKLYTNLATEKTQIKEKRGREWSIIKKISRTVGRATLGRSVVLHNAAAVLK